jgi:thioester reductase-like protein
MQGITKIYHCAAFISFDPSDRKMMRKVTVEGTIHLLNLSLEKKLSLKESLLQKQLLIR